MLNQAIYGSSDPDEDVARVSIRVGIMRYDTLVYKVLHRLYYMIVFGVYGTDMKLHCIHIDERREWIGE